MEFNITVFTNKNVRNDVAITLKKGRLINDEVEVAWTLNSHQINIVKTTCGQPTYDIASVDAMISNYKNHPSINQIRKKSPNPKKYTFPEAKKRRNKYTNQASESQKDNRSRWKTP